MASPFKVLTNVLYRMRVLLSLFMAFFNRLSKIINKLGPGFVTGAADDDPSGVATYSIAGARFGYTMLWMTLFLLPAMIAIQEMCGRIGLLTGTGLAGVIKKFYSKRLLWFAVSLLFIANTINIGADLGIIAASLQMLFGLSFYLWLSLSAVVIILLEVLVSYKRYSKILMWFGMVLLVYVVTAFLSKPDWESVLPGFLIPNIQWNMGYIITMVGFLGTTISPYLFFWQASEEVEEEIAEGQISDFAQRPVVSESRIRVMGTDTKMGMLFSNMITFFIILTTAATLNRNGIMDIATPQMAAQALKPLAGEFAYILFALGIIGIGLQSIPVLAGSIAYAASEALGIKEGLSKKFWDAKGFYLIIGLATLVGVLINLLGINTMSALYYAAIINGVIAVPLIFIIIKMADNKKIVGEHRTGKIGKFVAWTTLIFMAAAVLIMFGSIFD